MNPLNAQLKPGQGLVGNPLLHAYPCKENHNITIAFEPDLPPGEENQYHVFIGEEFPKQSRVNLKFDSEASVTLDDPTVARIQTINDFFQIKFFKKGQHLGFQVKGLLNGTIPYMTSLIVNGLEYCDKFDTGFLDQFVKGYKDTAEVQLSVPDESCGRRKIQYTELITNGLMTKAGDWPWHTAIYKLERNEIRYICGGTLLSKTFVLTAAHCATVRGVPVLPEILSVVLGKYNLIGGDVATQEREVHQVIVHEEFVYNRLDNDIALLKLKSEAVFTDYVQPACLWYKDTYKKLPQGNIYGTVVGWGFDHTDQLSPQLRQATMPKVSDATCIKSNPVFYGTILNSRKFCAGLLNGTSACNGDSGGGFLVFVPDTNNPKTGAWYVRGIVSLSVSRTDAALCDSSQYVVFTDVAKFRGWVTKLVK
ncbi:trypsin domain-containing protein [Phthorimaea operculella]|nr:trypsin domain-containing protein [Phthorimaea operculella]